MKITFVGSSHGVPAPDRYCSCAMFEVGKSIYFIDAGAPVIDEILRLGRDVHDVRAVFTTHVHGDHTNGILHMADLMNWYYRDSSADFYVTEQALADSLTTLISLVGNKLDTERIRFHTVDADFIYEDENLRLSLIPTKHMAAENRPAYAILIEAEGKRVLFSGDMSYMLEKADVPAIVAEEELDVFICEMAHFGVAQIAPYLETCKAKAVYFNHVYPFDKFDQIKALNGKYAFPVYLVADRDEINL